jgi:hypothetical protein
VLTIETSLLRLTWSVIEEAQNTNLLSLTDTGLVRLLLQRISKRILLTGEEVCLLYDYLSSKITLIRDITESRFIPHPNIYIQPIENEAIAPAVKEIIRTH